MHMKRAPPEAILPQVSDTEEDMPSLRPEQSHFRFLDLPFELRTRIYEYALIVPLTIDLDPKNKTVIAPQLRILRTCRQVYEEAYPIFYSKQTFRIFPTHPAHLYAKPRQLLLTRLPRKYREKITSLQLRFGPGWAHPPKCQVVKPKLGLADCISVRTLKVFVECDPSQDDILKNFRVSETFYTVFCGKLLQSVLDHVSSVKDVEFDGYPSVMKHGPLLQELIDEAEISGKRVTWGPQRRWDEEEDKDLVLEGRGIYLNNKSFGV